MCKSSCSLSTVLLGSVTSDMSKLILALIFLLICEAAKEKEEEKEQKEEQKEEQNEEEEEEEGWPRPKVVKALLVHLENIERNCSLTMRRERYPVK